MYQTIKTINDYINGLVWGVPAIVCILGVGLYLLVRTRGVQFRRFGYAMKNTIGKIFHKEGKTTAEGAITPFQAVCTALSATVGTGNIAGVAGAIAIGGPGAVFWMWISALLGMGTKFAEVTLAVHYRERGENGEYLGGPMYYIKNGLGKKWMWLAYLYAIFGVCTVFGTGNATQVNTITASIRTALENFNLLSAESTGLFNLIVGIAITVLMLLILVGGVTRIGKVSEKLVPSMAVLYVLLGLGVIVLNIDKVPAAFSAIFYGAFNPAAVTGGIVGSFVLSMTKGVSRGIFSNEAGLGTGSIAHACADTDSPVRQGMYGIFEVFMDTILICTLTALAILLPDISINYGAAAGAELTISGFVATYGGWVSVFTAVAMCCFAFSTIVGWGLYGLRCAEFVFGKKARIPFNVLYSLVAILGATVDLGLIWAIADTFNGLMAIPNLIGVALLTPTVVLLLKKFKEEA